MESQAGLSRASHGDRVPDETRDQRAARAVMIVLRLFRALERVDTDLTPQQYRILKLAEPAASAPPGWPSGSQSPSRR